MLIESFLLLQTQQSRNGTSKGLIFSVIRREVVCFILHEPCGKGIECIANTVSVSQMPQFGGITVYIYKHCLDKRVTASATLPLNIRWDCSQTFIYFIFKKRVLSEFSSYKKIFSRVVLNTYLRIFSKTVIMTRQFYQQIKRFIILRRGFSITLSKYFIIRMLAKNSA